jgi:hypothetical protein
MMLLPDSSRFLGVTAASDTDHIVAVWEEARWCPYPPQGSQDLTFPFEEISQCVYELSGGGQ